MKNNRLLLALAIWSVFGIVCLISEYSHAGPYTCTWHQYERGECLPILKDAGPMPPSLQRLMAEGAERVVAKPTLNDVRAVASKILLPIGEMMLLLGSFIALWDIRNEFLLWLLGVGLALLGLGLAFE